MNFGAEHKRLMAKVRELPTEGARQALLRMLRYMDDPVRITKRGARLYDDMIIALIEKGYEQLNCPTCGEVKDVPCPVCTDMTYSLAAVCTWCDGSWTVCPDESHFTGLRNE